ncbi:hypothetical protein DDE18_12860 [Nocardioides gansuensis]|uniref:LytR/CpsA/Psr regulator C-terminal domain-containing protein n=1 Tax=Nocardioides gansuensis TaxID=2138300 RepID=A0A2T8F9I8_9ACTN|nr:LytR C-terminal domain-containing protein [Nocardioides gansuensis]PVG82365.1 hypothetical protein DDE18_12860 [Nocardioides gansuensis]
MGQGARTATTLAVLSGLVVLASLWGWQATTKPLPHEEEIPLCSDTTVPAGTEIFRDQVVVSVFNGSTRTGLASATMEQLVERGFVEAETGNAPKKVRTVEIWSDQPTNPAVQLVQQQFRGARVVSGEQLGLGVVVVVGEQFKELGPNVESVTAAADATICSPPTE